MKTVITVSRKWNNPTIAAFVDTHEVGATMYLDEFIDSLLEEIGSPTFIMTKAQLASKVKTAATTIVDEMKRATVNV